MEILTGFINEFADAFLYAIVASTCPHPGTRGCHCLPVPWVYQDTFNKGPISAHPRFYRMNYAQLIPKYTITVCPLGNHGPIA
jgi:hypothetical protein